MQFARLKEDKLVQIKIITKFLKIVQQHFFLLRRTKASSKVGIRATSKMKDKAPPIVVIKEKFDKPTARKYAQAFSPTRTPISISTLNFPGEIMSSISGHIVSKQTEKPRRYITRITTA